MLYRYISLYICHNQMVRTTITISTETRDALRSIGTMEQTYDTLIKHLIDCKEKLVSSPSNNAKSSELRRWG